MSYRTFKRVLGETSLERKCRWWFGVSLIVLLTLSFTWYGRRTDKIVTDLNPDFIGPELVRSGWLEAHFSKLVADPRSLRNQESEGTAGAGKTDDLEEDFWRDFVEKSRNLGQQFQWEPILPPDSFDAPIPDKYKARGSHEQRWLAEWATHDTTPYHERYI